MYPHDNMEANPLICFDGTRLWGGAPLLHPSPSVPGLALRRKQAVSKRALGARNTQAPAQALGAQTSGTLQPSGASLGHVMRSSQWARRPRIVAYKGACRCPLAAAIGVRAGGDGLWRTASLHRFILCKLKGAIREVLSTRGKGTPAGSTTLESRPSLSPWVGSITVFFLFPSPPLPHQHYATVKAVREAIPVCGCGPGELPVCFPLVLPVASSLPQQAL